MSLLVSSSIPINPSITNKMPTTSTLSAEEMIANQRKAKKEWYLANRESVLEKNKARARMYNRIKKINKIVENTELVSQIIAKLRLENEIEEVCDCQICRRAKMPVAEQENNRNKEEQKEQ